MSSTPSGLSHALSKLAAGRSRRTESDPQAASPRPLKTAEADDEAALRDELPPQPAATPSRRRPVRRTWSAPNLHEVAAPVLLTVGVLLLVPAVWAVLVLLGASVWRSDWPGADRMSLIMLMCWPIAAGLIAGACWCWPRAKTHRRRR